VVVGGILTTFFVFAFLAWLQPVLKGGERIKVAAALKVDFNIKAPKKETTTERKKPQAQQKKARPKPRPKQRRPRAAQPKRRPQQTREIASPQIGANLGNISVLAAGTGGAGAVALALDQTAATFAQEAADFVRYKERRKRIRQGGFTRQAAMLAQRAASGLSIKKPVLRRQPKPRYPEKARKKGLGGRVVVRVLISIQGRVEESEIVSAEPEGYFEEAILEALPKWQFAPAKDEEGRPIEHWEEFTYVFRLKDA
jgi:protein TonB